MGKHDRVLLVLVPRAVPKPYLSVVWNVDSVVRIFPLRLVSLQILLVSGPAHLWLAHTWCFFAHHFEKLCVAVGDLAHIVFSRGRRWTYESIFAYPSDCVAVVMLVVS